MSWMSIPWDSLPTCFFPLSSDHMFKKAAISILLLPLTGCFDTELVFEDQYRVVVEAYLYVGKPTTSFNLTGMISFGNDSTGGEPVTGAMMVLEHGATSWYLPHNPASPGNYFLDQKLSLAPGDTCKLTVELDDETLTAFTVVPDNPPAVSMSTSSLIIPSAEDMFEYRNMEMPDPVELTWENPDLKHYFLRIDNIESSADRIMPDPPEDMPERPGGFLFQMITRPISDDHYYISSRDLTYYGTHRIIIFSVNEEYVSLYHTLDQDSRELNEPFSNIENGLGIFTAFSSDTLYLEVIKEN